jgi:hypothetical protein
MFRVIAPVPACRNETFDPGVWLPVMTVPPRNINSSPTAAGVVSVTVELFVSM